MDLALTKGEVHALLGENGAGKTTLMRILYGLTAADAGTIAVDGTPVTIHAPRDAIAAGIGMVTQHFSLVQPMTVTENVILGRTRGARLDLEAARRSVEEAADRFGIAVRPEAVVAERLFEAGNRAWGAGDPERAMDLFVLFLRIGKDAPNYWVAQQRIERLKRKGGAE